MDGEVFKSGDCNNKVAYYGVLVFNAVLAAATLVMSLVAIYKLISRQCGVESPCSFSLLFVSHVLVFAVCIVSSCVRMPALLSVCDDAYSNRYVLLDSSSFLLHWVVIIMIHSNRLRNVFDGTELRATASVPALSSLIVLICCGSFALILVSFLYDIALLRQARLILIVVTALGLIVASKVVAVAFIVKFCQLNNKLAGTSVDGDCIDFVHLLSKSTILAATSLLSSSTVAIIVVVLNQTSARFDILASAHTVDMFINCACVYLSLRVGSAHYDVLCEPVQSRCQATCLGISRSRRAAVARKNAAVPGASAEPSEVLKVEQARREEARRMSRRISFNVSSNTMIAHRSSTIVQNRTKMQKIEMPSRRELQEGAEPDISPARTVMGRRIEMDPEEELGSAPSAQDTRSVTRSNES